MSIQRIVQFGILSIGAFLLIMLGVYLVPWLFMVLWNDLSPHFGIDIQFTWWQTFKAMLLLGGVGWLFNARVGYIKGKKKKT